MTHKISCNDKYDHIPINLIKLQKNMRKVHLLKTQFRFKQKKQEQKRSMTVQKNHSYKPPQQPLKFYVGFGNNSQLVKRVLLTRAGWVQAQNSKQTFINIRWQQSNKGFKYENCIDNRIFRQSLNHFEYHAELSNKEYLFKNIYDYCQKNKINAFEFVPLTFILNLAESTFEQQQHFFQKFYNTHKPKDFQDNQLLLRRRRVNPNHLFSYAPKTGGYFCKYEIRPGFQSQNSPYLWILKPTFYNRGSGIHLFSKLPEMQEQMNRYMHGVTPASTSPVRLNPETILKKSFRIRQHRQLSSVFVIRTNSFVVQKYLERPLLVGDRKFDIRMWVLVTHELKVYLFRSGYLRTSSYNYSLSYDKIGDLNVHLTNNSVQKFNEDYGRYESGNQLSFQHLKQILKEKQKDYEELMNKIKNIVKISLLSVRKKLNKQERCYCFQIFGFDFMLDHECNPYLIEVNTNPCLEESSPLLQEILPRMLDDAFSLTIDQVFDIRKTSSHFSLGREEDKDNLWDLVVDLKKY